MKIENFNKIILFIGLITAIAVLFYRMGFNEGRHYGVGLGVHASLDTVKQILYKQLNNDSCATEMIFEGDTMSYVLTKKKLVDVFTARDTNQ